MLNFWFIIITAVVIEVITIIGRFGFNISTKSLWVKVMKHYNRRHWVHVHHVFIGLLVVAIALIVKNNLVLNLGLGVIMSDAIHHFIILWPLIGSPEFHIIYKNKSTLTEEQIEESKRMHKVVQHLIHHS